MALKILVVDDQGMIRDIHSKMLKDIGHFVTTAKDGQDGLNQFNQAASEEKPFDVVMTDEEMPIMTGHELAHRLYHDSPGLPILMISSSEDVDLMVSMMKMGIIFIRKPLRKEDLGPILDGIEKQIRLNRERAARKAHYERAEALLTTASFTLDIENDQSLIPSIIKYTLDFCEQHEISEQVTFRVHFGLEETIINAIAHGNLEMSSQEFKKDGNFKLWEEEMDKRRKMEPYRERTIKMHVHVQRGKEVKVSVHDEGQGFDHESVLSKITSKDIYQSFGRGLVMLKGVADGLEFNHKGNCVYMTFCEPTKEA